MNMKMPSLKGFHVFARNLDTGGQGVQHTHSTLPFAAMASGCIGALHKAGRVLRFLGRLPRVAEPCVGIGGMRSWAEACGLSYVSCVAHDFDSEIDEFYTSLKGEGSKGLEGVYCGPTHGDITQVPLSSLPNCEALVSGPPCQPYAPNGRGEGFDDPRSEIFEIVVRWVVELAWRGCLLCFLLENSTAIVTHAYFWKVVEQLQLSCPFFRIEVMEQDLKTLMPHSRPRVWVRGLRVDCLPSPESQLPPPLCLAEVCQQKLLLTDFLEADLPNYDPSQLTATMRANLALYKELAKEAATSKKAGA